MRPSLPELQDFMTEITIFESVEYFSMKNALFAKAYEELMNTTEEEDVPFNEAMSKFSQVLIDNIDSFKLRDLKHLFKIVDLYLKEGSEELVTGIKTCFLETLLTESAAGHFEFSKVSKQLGKLTTAYCHSKDGFAKA
jgi:hypothetical protein